MATSPTVDSTEAPSRFVVGIDLGTTNSALAYVDTRDAPARVVTFATPQLVAPATVEPRETLPSCLVEPAAEERLADALRLPWGLPSAAGEPPYAVGLWARDHGEQVPGRLIASAKSWLCHAGVDRTAELLPWHPAVGVTRLSPVVASARILAHFRAAWNAAHPDEPLERQSVVLTLPASFDEVARELTVRAARLAGLPRVTLLEEPQAAFYAWIDARGEAWQAHVAPGQTVLVCDIGGGTTDLTLIQARAGRDGQVRFQRVAVGEHLLLGGDNLDLALAHHVERRLAGEGKLDPRVWTALVRSCRRAKETLLGPQPPERWTLAVAGGGSKLIGGSRQVELTRDEVQSLMVDGFLPFVGLSEKPAARRSGFHEFGLPFAPDAAVTRYLASFLVAHRAQVAEGRGEANGTDPARPDAVLFNGGFFESPVLRERLLDVLASWFPSAAGTVPWRPRVLEHERLDLAVARGAAYYGMVRRGAGVRIRGGLPRSYYLGVTTDDGRPAALCLLPFGIEEGESVELADRRLTLRVREPVEFPLWASSYRSADRPGDVVPLDPEQLAPLPPIRTVIEAARRGEAAEVLVTLHARLTEIGTLDLWCGEAEGPRRWRLQFDIRAAHETDREAQVTTGEAAGLVDEAVVAACRAVLAGTFAGPAPARQRPESVVRRLEEAAGAPRRDWSPSLLRRLWEELLELEAGRRGGEAAEARWLYLTGFALRPGFGMAVDDWRVAQTWRLLQGKRVHHTPAVRVEYLILWRRIAAGLSAGQQQSLAEPLLAPIRAWTQARTKPAGRGGAVRRPEWGGGHETAEVWRLLGSLELLPLDAKQLLGEAALALATKEPSQAVADALVWAVGRVGARVPLYGPLNGVVDPETAADWARQLIERPSAAGDLAAGFALVQLVRRTDDRFREVAEGLRDEVASWLTAHAAPEHWIELVMRGGALATDEAGQAFGESLPIGLRLG